MSSQFQKFSGICSVLAGVAGLLYLVFFLVFKNPAAFLPAIALLVVGVLSSVVLVALYFVVRRVDEGFSLWGMLLGIIGAIGAAIHAAFDLTNNLHPPSTSFDFASPIDPRGFLTFAITGLAIILLSWLIVRSSTLSRQLGYFGLLSGALSLFLYLAYLVILDATNPLVLGLVLLAGIVQPIWYLWLGWSFLQMKIPLLESSA
jgi:hypothetical protein